MFNIFFIYLLMDCISSSVKRLLSSLAHLYIESFGFLVLIFLSSLYILKINAVAEVPVVKIFSHSVGFLFTFLIVSFAAKKLLRLTPPHLFIYFLVFAVLGIEPRALCLQGKHSANWAVSPALQGNLSIQNMIPLIKYIV